MTKRRWTFLIVGSILLGVAAVTLLGWDLPAWLLEGPGATLSNLMGAAGWVNWGIPYTVSVFFPGHIFFHNNDLISRKVLPTWARHLILWGQAALFFTLDGLTLTPLLWPGYLAIWGAVCGGLLWNQKMKLKWLPYPGRRQ